MKKMLSRAVIRGLLQACLALAALPSSAAAGPPDREDGAREILRNGSFDHPGGKAQGWELRSGGLGEFSFAPDRESGGKGNTLTVKVRHTSAKPWSMELLQRIGSPVASDSVLQISFDYRITPGYVFHFYWQVESSPWPKLLSLRLTEPADAWRHLNVTIPVHEGYQADSTALSFHLAEKIGELQLRNLSVLLHPPGTDFHAMPSSVAPVLGGDFYDNDWRNSILEKIRAARTTPVAVSVRRKGRPAAGAEVVFTQLRNDVRFGVDASGALLLPAPPEDGGQRDRRRPDGVRAAERERYRKLVLAGDRFDFVSVRDAFVWKEYDLWGRRAADALLEDIRASGAAAELPALFIPAFMHCPNRCRNMTSDDLWKELCRHLAGIARRHADRAGAFGVLHGPIKYNEIYRSIGVECLPEAFRQVRAQAPGKPCYLGSPDALGALSPAALNDLLELVNWLRNEKAAPDGVILQAGFHDLNVAPQTMEKRLESFAQAVRVPVHIRGLAVNEEKDDVQADMVRDFLLLFYANPRVASIGLGELWSGALLNPRLGYYTADFRPRAAIRTVRRLVDGEWRSGGKAVTDPAGRCAVRLPNGEYSVTARLGDGAAAKSTLRTRDVQADRPLLIELP